MNHIKVIKQFDAVIAAVAQGETVNLSDMPPEPTMPSCTIASENPSAENKEENVNQQTSADIPGNNSTSLIINRYNYIKINPSIKLNNF